MLLNMSRHGLSARFPEPWPVSGVLHEFFVDLDMQHMILLGIGWWDQWNRSQSHGILDFWIIHWRELALEGIRKNLVDILDPMIHEPTATCIIDMHRALHD